MNQNTFGALTRNAFAPLFAVLVLCLSLTSSVKADVKIFDLNNQKNVTCYLAGFVTNWNTNSGVPNLPVKLVEDVTFNETTAYTASNGSFVFYGVDETKTYYVYVSRSKKYDFRTVDEGDETYYPVTCANVPNNGALNFWAFPTGIG